MTATGAGGGWVAAAADGEAYVSVDEYLVCAGLGGGVAKEMAVHPKNQALKFIPWAGVAAHLKHNGSLLTDTTKGQAFCFLPLPKENGVPVHVNGYFELSSNRRDIWFGVDMSGERGRGTVAIAAHHS